MSKARDRPVIARAAGAEAAADGPTGPEVRPDARPVRPHAVVRAGVVLAAGRSERLHRVTGGGSKALVRLGGLALVERAVRSLLALGLERVVVVVGYHAGPVGAVVGRFARGRVRAVLADRWEMGNGASLAAAQAALAGEELFLMVTADHVFSDGALARLLSAPGPAVLVDPAPSPDVWTEGTRVRIVNGVATRFGKGLAEPVVDCGAFLLPAEVFRAQRDAAEQGDHSLAGAVSRLGRTVPLRAVPIPASSGWQDVDTPEDLKRARALVRRSLVKQADGPVSRLLNRPVSTRISMLLAPLRLSPDLVSVLVMMVGVVAAWFLADGRAVAGGVVVHLTSVLDGVDGEVARLQIRASARGAMLDGVMDRVADAAILAGLAVWAIDAPGADPGLVVVLTVAAVAGAIMSMASKDRAAALGLPPAPERLIGWFLAGRDGRLLIVAVGSLLGRPVPTLAAVAVSAALGLVVRTYAVRRLPAGRGSGPPA